MELEIIEIITEFRVAIDAGTMAIPVKARIVKHAEDEEATYWYETNYVFKEANGIGNYTPGSGGTSIQEAKLKLFDYLNKFQQAIDNGGSYQHAYRYID